MSLAIARPTRLPALWCLRLPNSQVLTLTCRPSSTPSCRESAGSWVSGKDVYWRLLLLQSFMGADTLLSRDNVEVSPVTDEDVKCREVWGIFWAPRCSLEPWSRGRALAERAAFRSPTSGSHSLSGCSQGWPRPCCPSRCTQSPHSSLPSCKASGDFAFLLSGPALSAGHRFGVGGL